MHSCWTNGGRGGGGGVTKPISLINLQISVVKNSKLETKKNV